MNNDPTHLTDPNVMVLMAAVQSFFVVSLEKFSIFSTRDAALKTSGLPGGVYVS
jgi:hypothetical protein